MTQFSKVDDTVQLDLIVFIGSKKNFSDTLLRNIEAECRSLTPARYDGFDDYLAAIVPGAPETRVVIVDPFLCRHAIEAAHGFAAAFRARCPLQDPPGFVIAHWDVETSQQVHGLFGDRVDLRGFLPMNVGIDIWLSIIRLLANGGTYYLPQLAPVASAPAPVPEPNCLKPSAPLPQPKAPAPPALTMREIDVAELLSRGLQNKQIAAELDVSEHTVKLHIHHIIGKLEVRNRTEAAIKYQAMRS